MRRRISIVAAAAFAAALLAGPPALADEKDDAKNDPFKHMTVEEVAQVLGKPNVHVYDGNSKDTYRKQGHLPGAVQLWSKSMKRGDLPENLDATLIFYCQNVH